MASEWPEKPLSDLTDPGSPITYGVVKPGEADPNGVWFIRGGDISGRRILTEQLRTITPKVSLQYQRTLVRGGEIVMSLVGNPGQVAVVPESLRGSNIARQAALIRLRGNVDTRFVMYFLSSRTGQEKLVAHSRGSVQQVINLRDLKTVRVPTPPLSEQRAIAHILGSLDDKIALNRRTNETLEALARAIFKSWFVDFDPVRAKAEGRDPGLPNHIADLFPDRFEDSELGEIPAGWKIDTLGNLMELAYGKALKQSVRKPGDVAVYGSNGQVGWHDERLVKGPGIIVGRKGNPGFVTWSPTGFFPIDTTFYVVPTDERLSLPFLFYALKTHNLPALSADSAVPGLNRNFAYQNQQIVPPDSVLDVFNSVVELLFQSIHKADKEAHTLADIRDALLPRLISGELRVGEAVQEVKEVL